MWLEFELFCFEAAVQHIDHYTTKTPLKTGCKKVEINVIVKK